MNLDDLKTGSKGVTAVADALHHQHRTTQADSVSTLLKGIYQWARESRDLNRIDLRNERAVRQVLQHLKPPKGSEPLTANDDAHLEFYVC